MPPRNARANALASLDRLERALHRRYGYERADLMIVIGRVRFIFARQIGRSSRSEWIARMMADTERLRHEYLRARPPDAAAAVQLCLRRALEAIREPRTPPEAEAVTRLVGLPV